MSFLAKPFHKFMFLWMGNVKTIRNLEGGTDEI